MTIPRSSPIVAMNFRKPALAIITALSQGHTLLLEREPSNPYDSNAVKVLVDLNPLLPQASFWEEVDLAIERAGVEREDLLSAPFHLGYIDSSKTGHAALVAEAIDNGANITATLGFDGSNGKPVAFLTEAPIVVEDDGEEE